MYQSVLTRLTLDSQLADLPSYHFEVNPTALVKEIDTKFKNHPELPGVLILQDGQLIGMISKPKFLEKMSQPYSLELYLKRSVKTLWNTIKTDFLQLPNTVTIEEASLRALNRPAGLTYEPVVVVDKKNNRLSILDLHTLLLAQSQVLTLANSLSRKYSEKLDREKSKVREYASSLEIKQLEIQQRNQLLEKQKVELAKKAQENAELNQRMMEISKLLSQRTKRAFEAVFSGVKGIERNTDKVIRTGNALAKELETVDTATKLIEHISKQVNFLGVQAAIVANNSALEMGRFSEITSKIGDLGNKTFETSNAVNQIASKFKLRIQELTDAARAGEITSRSILQHMQLAEAALSELEELVTNEQSKIKEPLLTSSR